MATQTSKLNLRKPEENDYYNEQLEQVENWDKVDEAVSNDTGAIVGHNGIKYIQDAGQKVAGKLYYDKLQSGLWYCKVTNSDKVNNSNFEDWSNYANGDKLKNLFEVLFDRESLGSQHLEFKLGEYSIKCGYVGIYRQGDILFFDTSFKTSIYYASAIQHNTLAATLASANYFSAKDVTLDSISFTYMSGNGVPTPQTSIMWIAVGK